MNVKIYDVTLMHGDKVDGLIVTADDSKQAIKKARAFVSENGSSFQSPKTYHASIANFTDSGVLF